jgi:hypothetical protein
MRNRINGLMCLVAMIASSSAALCAEPTWRWIEAEDAVATNMSVRHPFAPASDEERAKLSGGKWIGGPDKRSAPLFAVYDVDVPADGTYQLYARKFWKHGPYRVSFGDQTVEVGDNVAMLDNIELRQWVVVNWTPAGEFKLKAGKNRFRIESTKNEGAIAFDCFVLTREAFTPRGLLKPDAQLTSDTPGFFAWDAPADIDNSPIDLRWMNEPAAGGEGFIAAQGEQFILPHSKKPIRFWGVNVGTDGVRLPDRELDHLASMLARRGVNLVRLHGAFYKQEGPDVGKIDDAQLANIRRAVSVFKRHGIYSTLSIYFPVWVKLDAKHGWPGYQDKNPFALLFVDEKFQTIYRNWWHELLTRTDANNPVALKDEPAVLSLEILNEDSLFFWTFTPYRVIPASTTEQFERRFATFLTGRYGSIGAALKTWGAEPLPGDDPTAGRVGLGEPWRWFNKRDQRSKDTVTFLYETQKKLYEQTRDYLRNDLGTKSLISASNWTTASEQYLAPLERASYLACDFVDTHGYFGGTHEGPRAGWLVSENDKYLDRSALRFDPEKPGEKRDSWNPALGTTYNERPWMISEIDWLEPNAYRGEAPLICAAYGAMQDVDALAFFATGTASWNQTISKFALMSPVSLGEFPAAALIYRQGLVATAPPIVDGAVSLKDLLDLQGGLTGIDGKSKLIGRSRLRIDDTPTNRPTVDIANNIDGTKITSSTRQLTLDHGTGLLRIDAPAAKGVVGFLSSAGEIALDGLTIRSEMPFGSIVVVALDGKPISESRKLLVQVMSQQQNSGWKAEGEPLKTIQSFGTPPLLVKDFSGTIRLAGERKWTATRIGPNLAPLGDALPIDKTLTLDATTPYYVLTPLP